MALPERNLTVFRSIAALGVIGVTASGPLLATLLAGRTGAVPGLRWLGLAVAVWVTLSALAAAFSGGAGWRRWGLAMTKLAPLAAVSPLLPLLYLDDGINHVVSSGELRSVYVTVMAALAALGIAWRLAADSGIHQNRVEGAMTMKEDGATLLRFPAVAAPLIGLLAQVALNDLVFEPLGARGGEITLAHALPGALLALAGWFLLVRSGLVRLRAALAVLATAFASLALLAPVLPRLMPLVQPAVAALTLLLVAHPAFWARLSVQGRWVTSGLIVAGFALLSTLLGRYGLAAGEVVAAWPLVVSPPVFGLLLASAAMALRAAARE